jgi:DNA mismatch endonuclease, patch repair protein
MSRVRSKDTKPEMQVRSFLHSLGFRFRVHRKDLPGCPDIVLPKYRTAILVHGCFWHQHCGCPKARLPKQNHEFWAAKLRANATRDTLTKRELSALGWNVITIWECELKK